MKLEIIKKQVDESKAALKEEGIPTQLSWLQETIFGRAKKMNFEELKKYTKQVGQWVARLESARLTAERRGRETIAQQLKRLHQEEALDPDQMKDSQDALGEYYQKQVQSIASDLLDPQGDRSRVLKGCWRGEPSWGATFRMRRCAPISPPRLP